MLAGGATETDNQYNQPLSGNELEASLHLRYQLRVIYYC